MELDRISSLPNGVTEKILSLLLPWEAAKTSVLSTNWRYKSAMLQDLDFDESSWDRSRNHEVGFYDGQNPTSFVNMVDHVLLLHIGPIRMFKLTYDCRPRTRDIDRWVTHLSRNSIKELILSQSTFYSSFLYKIPLCVFSCQDLVCLELSCCVLKPPSTFKGFRSLKSLRLEFVYMDQDVFEILICCSPLLERLTLEYCQGVTTLKIQAPNLQYLNFFGEFDVVNLESVLNITEAEVYLRTHAEYQSWVPDNWVPESWVPSSSSNLLKIFDHLPDIRSLKIKLRFLKYLSLGVLPEKLPKPCEYLKFLSLHIWFDDPDEILTALCILRSSPVLQKLEILMDSTRTPGVVEEQKSCSLEVNCNCTLPQLRLVKISEISGVKAELDFIRFLLLSSPLLERMTITSPRFPETAVDGLLKLVKELLQLKRESKHAEIILLDT